MLKLNEIYQGITVQAQFLSRFNLLVSDSGTGKTLLLSAISRHCQNNHISCRFCNYNDRDLGEEKLQALCSDADVVLLDNADLYLTNRLLDHILSTAKTVIISMKDCSVIHTAEAEMYLTNYANRKVTVRKL